MVIVNMAQELDAIYMLSEGLSPAEFARITIAIGPGGCEIETGRYARPVDELTLWSKHYGEVLAKT